MLPMAKLSFRGLCSLLFPTSVPEPESSWPASVRDVPVPQVPPLPSPPSDIVFVVACDLDTSDEDSQLLLQLLGGP